MSDTPLEVFETCFCVNISVVCPREPSSYIKIRSKAIDSFLILASGSLWFKCTYQKTDKLLHVLDCLNQG